MSSKGRIVVIDDEVNAAAALETLLREDGYEVAARQRRARRAAAAGEARTPDVVLTDLRMPGMDGLELLARIKEIRPETMVILMTAYGTVKTAVKAMKLGAEDYLGKPIDVEELEVVLQRALEKKRLLEETRVPARSGSSTSTASTTWWARARRCWPRSRRSGRSRPVERLGAAAGRERHRQGAVRPGPPPEQPAQRTSPSSRWPARRCPRRCWRASCSATRRARSPARIYTRAGRFEAADGGTLFLDEIGDISPTVQVKLLRFLEEREFERVGGNRTFKVDVRIVAATHRDLQEEGRGRQLPRGPLLPAQRHRDPHPAAARAAGRHPAPRPPLPAEVRGGQRQGRSRGFSDEALALLLRHPWPGNVRELENAIERAVVLAERAACSRPAHFPTLRGSVAEAPQRRRPALGVRDPRQHPRRHRARGHPAHAGGGGRQHLARGRAAATSAPRKIQYKLKEYQQQAQAVAGRRG